MPAEKTTGSTVYAGSINQSGALEIRADRIGRDTSYGKIIEAVETAERSRARPHSDWPTGWLAILSTLLWQPRFLTYLITRDIRSTIRS